MHNCQIYLNTDWNKTIALEHISHSVVYHFEVDQKSGPQGDDSIIYKYIRTVFAKLHRVSSEIL